MKIGQVRAVLRTLAGVAIFVVVWANLLALKGVLGPMPPRESEEIVVKENLIRPILWALDREHYDGEIEFITAGSLKGREVTRPEGVDFVHFRYIAIPRNLMRDRPDLPWVLGDFTVGDPRPNTPDGLAVFLDPGNGLVLYKRQFRK